MSLSSFLLPSTSKAQIDTELDSLFKFAKKEAPTPKNSKKRRAEAPVVNEDGDKEPAKKRNKTVTSTEEADVGTSSELEDDDDDRSEASSSSPPAHETAENKPKREKRIRTKAKKASEETTEQQNLRTIFIGNLPIEIVKKTSHTKTLQRHLLAFLPPKTVIESTRFRSVPLKAPTSQKKIAVIKGELHPTADFANAYVVFGQSEDPEALDPQSVARLAVEKANGSEFMERRIRVDLVSHSGSDHDDRKNTIFVGNLDFETKEDELRGFFETALEAEGECVKSVRIVRDRETLLGKGFAYVRFCGTEFVDEVLALNAEKLKFKKRNLRVQKCKSLVQSSSGTKAATTEPRSANTRTPNTRTPRPDRRSTTTPIPRGDPTLGHRLAHLNKEDRKSAKKADMARAERRLAKKRSKQKQSVSTLRK